MSPGLRLLSIVNLRRFEGIYLCGTIPYKNMKAVIYERYGPPEVLQPAEVAKPVPKSDEVLIRIYASSVTAGDWRLRKADPFLARIFNGLFKPRRVKILGFESAGVIEDVGKEVKWLKKGDAVFAFCGLKFGGYAEYQCLRESDVIALKPANISFEQAAATPLGALTALCFLRKAGIQPGQNVMIYGASGSVGTFAVQLARHFGAAVTAVCSSRNLELVTTLGAHQTLDYTRADLTAVSSRFDIVFDAVGKAKRSALKKLLKSGGRYVSVNGQVKPAKSDLLFIRDLIESHALTTVLDRIYDLDEIREAHRYVESFRKRGNVAVRIVKMTDP